MKRARWLDPLRMRLILGIGVSVIVCCAIMYGGFSAYYWVEDLRQQRTSLSLSERTELQNLEQATTLTDTQLQEIGRLYNRYWVDPPSQDLAIVWAALGAASLLTILAMATWFARHILRPIETVAAAARDVASGDLEMRVPPHMVQAAAGEIRQLLEDFNFLAEAIQRNDRTLRENNAAIAHELRTPLTVVRGHLHALRDGVFEATEERLNMLAGQTDLLIRIVEDLRTLSLAAAAKLTLDFSTFDLADVARQAVVAFAPQAGARGMHIQMKAGPARVHADRARIVQVLQNLIENALRYAANGREIVIATGTEEDRAILCVLDRGPGIPIENAGELFEPFVRAEQSRSRASGGSGLGLSVVRAICGAHGARAVALPREGGGAEFRIELPADLSA